jgi:hypothetical protein
LRTTRVSFPQAIAIRLCLSWLGFGIPVWSILLTLRVVPKAAWQFDF